MLLKLFRPIDDFIDGLSMYRLLLYYLIGLLVAAIGLSAVKDMHYSALQIAGSAAISVTACWLINKAFAYIFDAPVNPESSLLTGLILTLIIPPSFQNYGVLFILAASGLAIASKYLVTIGEKHIFNPAAIAVVLTALGPRQNASWWLATSVMLPFVIIGGILITRKVRRENMVITFLIVTTITTAVLSVAGHSSVSINLKNMVLSSPIFFLAFVMLTEPYTSPTTKKKQLWYAAIVGFLIAPQVHIGSAYTSPEIGLVIGNIFAYIVSPKTKLFPLFQEKVQIAASTFEFSFLPIKKLAFEPGQYMEFTLPHTGTDSRGTRRWFTIASSPTENQLKLGIKFYKDGSSFKTAMFGMDKDSQIMAAQVAGDFVMPKDQTKKLVFIAGGIGITPFRSMAKYLIDNNEARSVRLLYGVQKTEDLAYKDVFETARRAIGMQTTYFISDPAARNLPNIESGRITIQAIEKYVPDYSDCIFYISGTHAMVEEIQFALHDMGVHKKNVKIDFFPGYA